ncbi:hypothetical protein KEM56_004744 [Ascosphaera pollenicola]|nr:hypothetical protein KEM56_004744 [Ascosphaera pollenicola]
MEDEFAFSTNLHKINELCAQVSIATCYSESRKDGKFSEDVDTSIKQKLAEIQSLFVHVAAAIPYGFVGFFQQMKVFPVLQTYVACFVKYNVVVHGKTPDHDEVRKTIPQIAVPDLVWSAAQILGFDLDEFDADSERVEAERGKMESLLTYTSFMPKPLPGERKEVLKEQMTRYHESIRVLAKYLSTGPGVMASTSISLFIQSYTEYHALVFGKETPRKTIPELFEGVDVPAEELARLESMSIILSSIRNVRQQHE